MMVSWLSSICLSMSTLYPFPPYPALEVACVPSGFWLGSVVRGMAGDEGASQGKVGV